MCPPACIILGNRLFIIHCISSLKCIQACGKSEGFWSDPTSNNALESPTDDIYDGQWQLPEQIPGQVAPEENKTMPERASFKPAMATPHPI